MLPSALKLVCDCVAVVKLKRHEASRWHTKPDGGTKPDGAVVRSQTADALRSGSV